ncbi:MAG: DNA-binding response regulator [Caulobacterales bacterium 32-69-10]|nr:MAG: DNA-binding response regulator [Caulobacterales bacterium 32-69-10]
MDLTTFVVDDDEPARNSLTFLLRTEGVRCRSFSSGPKLLAELHPNDRGCIVTDVRMPEMDGIALVEALRGIGCRIPVIVITGHADVPLAVRAMKAGVIDFIEKPFESDTILRAVRHALERSLESGLEDFRREMIDRRAALLTDREKQVCAAIVEGFSNKEVALTLNISPRTVEIYRANVMSKMQADSLSELVRMMLVANAA